MLPPNRYNESKDLNKGNKSEKQATIKMVGIDGLNQLLSGVGFTEGYFSMVIDGVVHIIKIHRKLLPAPKGAGLTEFSFDSGFLGCRKGFIQHLKVLVFAFSCINLQNESYELE